MSTLIARFYGEDDAQVLLVGTLVIRESSAVRTALYGRSYLLRVQSKLAMGEKGMKLFCSAHPQRARKGREMVDVGWSR